VEAKRLAKLQNQLKEALSGERMASFLPLVRDLSEEYDPQAIAAAALQMIYDQNCPQWMKTDWEVPAATSSKPVINKTPAVVVVSTPLSRITVLPWTKKLSFRNVNF